MVVITCGFQEVKLDCFRQKSLNKGKKLLDSYHVSDVQELKFVNSSEILGTVLRETPGATSTRKHQNRWGSISTLKLLLNEGQADVNAVDNKGWTPLHWAVERGHLDIVNLLINSKNNTIDFRTINGNTSLHLASKRGHENIVEALLDSGNARSDIKDVYGQTPVHLAASGTIDNKGILKIFNDRKLLNMYDKTNSGMTLISCATANKNTFDFFVNMDDKYGMTVLQHVSIQEHINLLDKLWIYQSDYANRYKRIFPKDDFNPLYPIIGRNKELHYIKKSLRRDKKILITGISGMGKTALVKSYAWGNKNHYSCYLFWIDCKNQESIKYCFFKIAKYLKIPRKKYGNERYLEHIVKDIFNQFKSTIGLLVFDNVINIAEVEKYLIEAIAIDVIIISNVITSWKNINYGNCLYLQPIDEEAALSIFEPLFEDLLLKENERSNMKTLIALLQGIPLVLQIAKMRIMHKVYKYKYFDFLSVYMSKIASKICDKQIYYDMLIENEYERVIYAVIDLNFIDYQLLVSCSFLNPCFINLPCVLKLLYIHYLQDLKSYNSVLPVYIRNSVFNIKSNQVSINIYATKLALFDVKYELNFEANCYKAVLELFLQDLPSYYLKFIFSEDHVEILTKTLGDEFLHHHRIIFSFAEEFSTKIKGCILNSKKAIKENPALCKLMQYLAKNGCVKNLFSIFANLDTNIKEKLVKKLKLSHAAVESGDTRTVSLVYQYDNNIRSRNDLGHTLIWVAIEGNHTSVLDYLISKGASYADTDKLNKTPLHRAAFLGRIDIVKFLLEKGVDPNIRNKFHRAPLHYAAMEGYNEIIIELLSHKDIDINARDHYRRSPIFETVRCFQLDSLKLFIEYGAKVITKDILDMSPYRLAKRQKNKDLILEVFKKYGYTDETVVENKWTLCKIRIV